MFLDKLFKKKDTPTVTSTPANDAATQPNDTQAAPIADGNSTSSSDSFGSAPAQSTPEVDTPAETFSANPTSSEESNNFGSAPSDPVPAPAPEGEQPTPPTDTPVEEPNEDPTQTPPPAQAL